MTAASLSIEEARAHAEATVKRSGTSFAAGMRILSKPRRDAMHAVYAFCREVDDIADSDADVAEKRVQLAGWRSEIDRLYQGRPQFPTGVALLEPVRAFGLEKNEFILMIEGMEMDAEGPIVAPTMETLFAYTRRVAGSVGMLSMPIFGAPRSEASERFALALGDAFQLTNILRDVGEDAAIGRLYLPLELLEKYDAPRSPGWIVGAEGVRLVARDVGEIAKKKFAEAREALNGLDWRAVRPALLMMGVYEAYLKKLEKRGWEKVGTPLSLSKPAKLAISARWFFAPRLKG
ncbi:MAG: squalene/phytoene synthase family protein [Pseudomonadota bacterium]|nr:squalene/phytoene synthase family protein [Pseudomonadota bacterium]